MENKHCIESAILQISYSSEELALSQHSQLETFAKSELLLIVDEAFNEISGPGEVLGIEKLEIDLGEISLAYFYEDFGALLKQKIKELIDNHLEQSKIDGSNAVRKVSTHHSEFEIICQFLQSGRLPWNADSQQDDIEKLMRRIIDNNGIQLIDFVRASQNRNDLITRLTTQFQTELLCSLFALIVQPRFAELTNLLEKMFALGSEHFSLNRSDIQRRVWADLFQAALLSRSSKLSSKDIVARIIQVFSMHVPQRYAAFIERLARISAGDRRNSVVSTLIQEVLSESVGSDLLDRIDSDAMDDQHGSGSINDKREQEDRARLLSYKARFLEALDRGTIARLQPVWESLRKESPEMLVETLRTLGQSVEVRRNIAQNFSEPMIKDIVELLEPTNYRFIEQVVSEPNLYLRSEAQLQVPEADAKKSLWEFTLTYLLVERGSRFNKKSYVGSVMVQLAANLNIRVGDIYQSILALLQPISSTSSVYSGIVDLVVELQADLFGGNTNQHLDVESKSSKALGSDVEARSEHPSSQNTARNIPPPNIVEAVRLAFAGTDLSELKAIWKTLLAQHSDWFKWMIHDSGRSAVVRKNISRSFSNPMFEIVIQLIEPRHAKFLTEIIHRSTTKPPVNGVRRPVAQNTKRLVREFTLAYLLVDRGSEFNRKVYLAGLVKQLAAHENMSSQAVLLAILDSIDSVAYKSAFQQEILAMMHEVSKELKLQTKSNLREIGTKVSLKSVKQERFESAKERSDAEGNSKEFEEFELIRAYLLYEKLVAEIRSSNGAISYHVVRLIHELIEHYPWIFHRFNQEVSSGQLSLAPIIGQLPKSLQRKLVASFFTSVASRYRFSLAEFEKKLDEFVASNTTNNAVYEAVLSLLVGNHVSSLDSIFDQVGQSVDTLTGSDKSTAGQVSRQQVLDSGAELYSRENSTPLSLNKSTSNLIKAYLLGQLNFSDQDKGSIASTLELLLSSHPSALALLLKESLVDKQAAHRLVDILPESLLVKLLLLLRPNDHTKSILYADLMTMAAVEVEKLANGISGLLHLSKWQFVFDYMVIEGRRFNEINFVKMFSKHLQERSSFTPKTEFSVQLSKSVSKASTGGAYSAAVRIAMILGSGIEKIAQDRSLEFKDLADSPQPQAVEKEDSQHGYRSYENDQFEAQMEKFEDDDTPALESIYINNAGLVLLAPYIPRYFDMLGLLEKNKFKSREEAERGVHLLQYLLNESTNSYEYQLVLNKLLCGVDAGVPIARGIDITTEEKEASMSLLKGVIGNWPILKNTSIEGFRESFLLREAHLQLKNDSWQLQVQSKAYDMLLDSLPWSYSTIKLSWMKRPIQVDWR